MLMNFLQQQVDALTQSGVFSGIEWRVDQNAQTLFAGWSGVQNVQTGMGIPDKAVYRIYSMTKPITSIALMMLFEEGRFQLTDPVFKFIPTWRSHRVWVEGEGE